LYLQNYIDFLQALGLISKVQLTEGRGRKPAFQYIGPPVEDLEITEEQKQEMPAIRYALVPMKLWARSLIPEAFHF
jgi:hypothetical protein